MKIPKVIHYCWFGENQISEEYKKCILSWKKYCPDYKIKEWNEDNFDIHSNKYVEEAYNAKKYAFVTDYVRLYALYTEGGIYMDTDVEVLKPLDRFLDESAFSSFESNDMIPTGIMGAEKENVWIKDLLDEYKDLRFIKEDGTFDTTTNVIRITNLTVNKYGLIQKSSYQKLKDGIVTIYPFDYFCPKDWKTGKINLTENSYTIHHFSGSWLTAEEQERKLIISNYIKLYIKKGYDSETAGRKAENKYRLTYYPKHPIKLVKKIKEKISERSK